MKNILFVISNENSRHRYKLSSSSLASLNNLSHADGQSHGAVANFFYFWREERFVGSQPAVLGSKQRPTLTKWENCKNFIQTKLHHVHCKFPCLFEVVLHFPVIRINMNSIRRRWIIKDWPMYPQNLEFSYFVFALPNVDAIIYPYSHLPKHKQKNLRSYLFDSGQSASCWYMYYHGWRYGKYRCTIAHAVTCGRIINRDPYYRVLRLPQFSSLSAITSLRQGKWR